MLHSAGSGRHTREHGSLCTHCMADPYGPADSGRPYAARAFTARPVLGGRLGARNSCPWTPGVRGGGGGGCRRGLRSCRAVGNSPRGPPHTRARGGRPKRAALAVGSAAVSLGTCDMLPSVRVVFRVRFVPACLRASSRRIVFTFVTVASACAHQFLTLESPYPRYTVALS